VNIHIRLQEPILPEGAAIDADVSSANDLAFLSEAILKVYEEADMARVPTPGIRLLEAKVNRMVKAVMDGLPAEVKLDIANKASL
jgi:hypothetical protein